MKNKEIIFENNPFSLRARDIKTSYKKNIVLNGVDLVANFSEITCIIGRNGAGKSTFLKSLMKEIPFTGEFLFNNSPITKKVLVENFEYIPQVSLLIEDLSVRDNLVLLRKKGREFYLDSYKNIEELFDKKARELSLGQKRRVVIESAIVNEPKFLIMDEPLAGLDFLYKEELLNRLLELKNSMGILMTTHQVEGLKCADVIYKLDEELAQIKMEELWKTKRNYL